MPNAHPLSAALGVRFRPPWPCAGSGLDGGPGLTDSFLLPSLLRAGRLSAAADRTASLRNAVRSWMGREIRSPSVINRLLMGVNCKKRNRLLLLILFGTC